MAALKIGFEAADSPSGLALDGSRNSTNPPGCSTQTAPPRPTSTVRKNSRNAAGVKVMATMPAKAPLLVVSRRPTGIRNCLGCAFDRNGVSTTKESVDWAESVRKRYCSRRDCPRMAGCVEWRMTPLASVTEMEPAPVSPARADARLGPQSASGASGPPMRWLCTESCRSEASAAVKAPRTYSARIDRQVAGARGGRAHQLLAPPGEVGAANRTQRDQHAHRERRNHGLAWRHHQVGISGGAARGRRSRDQYIAWNSANGRWIRWRKAASKATP